MEIKETKPKATRSRFVVRGKRLVLFGLLVGVVAAGALQVLWLVDPVGYRLLVFQPMREMKYFMRELDARDHWSSIEKIRIPAPERFVVPGGEDEITIVADRWDPEGRQDRAILLLHGSSPWGRRAALMRLLGKTLSDRGWLVLAPDSRGFGETGDPPRVDDPSAWAVENDVRRSLDALAASLPPTGGRLFVLGHSLGANYALEGALHDPRVDGLVLVGPARYVEGDDAVTPEWVRTRIAADQRLDRAVTREVALDLKARGDIAGYADGPLGQPGHKPLVLIDGEIESFEDREFLGRVAARIAPPIRYVTLKDTGHYCGVRSFFGSSTVYYRPDLFEAFLESFLDVIEAEPPSSAEPDDSVESPGDPTR